MRRPGHRAPVTTPEQQLLARARAGDVGAFEALAAAYTDRIFSLVARIVGDRADAEDVTQESLLRAWRGIGRFDGRSTFFTWLYRIAVNEANRALERRGRLADVPVDDATIQLPAPAGDGPLQTAEQGELRSALERALVTLPASYRTAVILRDLEGLSTREAAGIVGVGEAAFKSRLHEARLKLRQALGDELLIMGALSLPGS